MANTISLSQILQSRPAVCPTIYGYILPGVPDHNGYIKVGYTDKDDVEARIKEQTHTAGLTHKTLFAVSAMRDDGTCFTDKDIHAVLKKNGFMQLKEGEDHNEWFKVSEKEVLAIINAVRNNTKYSVGRTAHFGLRAEQARAVNETAAYFKRMEKEDPTRPPKYLWNAKMRFGKTFASYQLAKKLGYKKILVLTFKPAVESAWYEDLETHVDFEGWQFVSDMAHGKSIELFLANGTADSLIIAELSNWNGKAIKIPRIEVTECKRDDIKGAGVYFLFCKEEDDTDSVYIGESETVQDRLIQHLRDYNAEKEKFYWTTAVIFLGRDLNKALIRYLEDRFVQIARECKRYNVLTKNTYSRTVMKEAHVAAMEEFIDNVRVLINALGYKVLEPTVQKTSDSADEDEKLYLNTGAVRAVGIVTSEGFVLLAGSKINEKASEKSLNKGAIALRKKHFAAGRVKDLTTTEDILFSSSSAAADFVTGYSVSGPASWKNAAGQTLKEIESK